MLLGSLADVVKDDGLIVSSADMWIGYRERSEKSQPGLVPFGNGAALNFGGFVDILYYLQICGCRTSEVQLPWLTELVCF